MGSRPAGTLPVLRVLLIALGIAMVVVAIAWRARDLRRRAGGIEAALRSADASTRTRALREIASVGLRPWASSLLARTREVGDGVEADELVWLIGACQWEPADEPEIVQLRLWAARRLERAPAAPAVAIDASRVPDVEHAPLEEPRVEEASVVEARDEDTPPETPPDDAPPPPGARPEFVDEIEEIVGARVLAVAFVPLGRGAA
jgi:hypothetical protein